jgi:hypothetical protein
MKCCSEGLPVREVGIKGIEGLETLTEMPRFVQRAILFQLSDEAYEGILDRHLAQLIAGMDLVSAA